jgi:hypothetical protein
MARVGVAPRRGRSAWRQEPSEGAGSRLEGVRIHGVPTGMVPNVTYNR